MTVKCLPENQKALIAEWYQKKIYTQKELAKHYDVSERTIHRILEEKGLATPVARIKGEAYQLVKLVRSYGLTNADLEQLLKTVGSSVPLAQESRDILKAVRSYKMTADQLKMALAAPALTHQNVQHYLNQCSKEQLAELFFNSGLAKITEMVQAKALKPIPTSAQQELTYAPQPQ